MELKRSLTSEITHRQHGKKVKVEGWLYDMRDIGKIRFLILRDRTGFIQITATKDKTNSKVFDMMVSIPRESVISIIGKVKKSKQAPEGREIIPESLVVLNEAIETPKIDMTERSKTDISKRIDYRWLDTRRKNISPIFKIRSKMYKSLVNFFDSQGFTNINVPKITTLGLETGAESFSVDYFGKKAVLAQSPQFYKQMFVIGGFERVYMIEPVYRAEKSHTTRHLTEFIGVDFEIGFIKDHNDIMDIIEDMIKQLLKDVIIDCKKELDYFKIKLKIPKKIPRLTMREVKKLLAKRGKKLAEDDDLDAEAEALLDKIVKEKYKEDFVFVTLYPWKKRPFYHMRPDNDKTVSKSFDLIWNGVEVATGSQREHRYDILKQQAEEKGIKLDPVYGNIFRYGAPPHGGVGFGLDRMTQKLLNLDNIREALLLTRDPERLTP